MALREFYHDNTIDLIREEGNVFSLIAVAMRLAKQLDKDARAITGEMMKADYRNALFVFDREFGEFVNLKLPPDITAKSVKDSYLKANLDTQAMQEAYLR